MPEGGVLLAPSTSCPIGSTLEYSIDNVSFFLNLPLYDQVNPMTIYTRCLCTGDNIAVSPTTQVTTTPATCPSINPLVMDLSISDPCFCFNPLNRVSPVGYLFHDILTVTTTPDAPVTLVVTDNNLLDVNGIPIPIGTVIPQTATPGIYGLDFYTVSGVPSTITVSNIASTETFTTASCNVSDCNGQATGIPTMSEWGLMIFGLLVVNMSVLFLRRREELFISTK